MVANSQRACVEHANVVDTSCVSDAAFPALTLYRLGKLVTASLDLDTTLEAIVAAAHQLIESESTAILLLEDGEHLVIRAGCGAVVGSIGERVPVGAGVVGRALRDGRPVRVDDMLNEPGRARPDLDARSGIRSFLAAPLVWRGVSLGVITAGALSPGAYGDTEAELAGELAEQAAAGVAHARAYADQRERSEELESLNRSLVQAEQRLVQTEKLTAIGHLAHGIAHELNTPLGVIISNLSVLEGYGESLGRLAVLTREAALDLRNSRPLDAVASALEAGLGACDLDYMLEDLPALTTESTDSAQRIADIVRSVSIFAQTGAGHMGPIDIEEALDAALTLALTEIKHRAKVVRAFAGVPAVVGNASELTQVFVHLLLNAAQALDERGGLVTVSTADENGQVAVRIADNGHGIPKETLGRVFEPFFTTRAIGDGTGLGLSVCHGIITRHAGTIDLQSPPSGGTTVTVRLAVASSAAATTSSTR
jgi:two-component system, NtrC family, sensor kinase